MVVYSVRAMHVWGNDPSCLLVDTAQSTPTTASVCMSSLSCRDGGLLVSDQRMVLNEMCRFQELHLHVSPPTNAREFRHPLTLLRLVQFVWIATKVSHLHCSGAAVALPNRLKIDQGRSASQQLPPKQWSEHGLNMQHLGMYCTRSVQYSVLFDEYLPKYELYLAL